MIKQFLDQILCIIAAFFLFLPFIMIMGIALGGLGLFKKTTNDDHIPAK